MPIEIKELVIKVNVNVGAADNSKSTSTPTVDNAKALESLTEVVTEQMLDLLKRKEER